MTGENKYKWMVVVINCFPGDEDGKGVRNQGYARDMLSLGLMF